MKKIRSIRPQVHPLETKTLLSGGMAAHELEHSLNAPSVADVARRPVRLIGDVVYGTGYVWPMGGVNAVINVRQKTLTLVNAGGNVKIRMTQVHRYPNTFTARAYQIIKGTRAFRAYHGQGHASVTAITLGGRLNAWSADFWA